LDDDHRDTRAETRYRYLGPPVLDGFPPRVGVGLLAVLVRVIYQEQIDGTRGQRSRYADTVDRSVVA
jgi:hypothetical protein